MLTALCALAAASLAANAVLASLFFKTKKNKRAFSGDARALLLDIMAGDALVRVTRIAPEDVLIRSPRDLG